MSSCLSETSWCLLLITSSWLLVLQVILSALLTPFALSPVDTFLLLFQSVFAFLVLSFLRWIFAGILVLARNLFFSLGLRLICYCSACSLFRLDRWKICFLELLEAFVLFLFLFSLLLLVHFAFGMNYAHLELLQVLLNFFLYNFQLVLILEVL